LQHFAKEKLTIALSANAHAKTESKAIQEEYVQRFRFDPVLRSLVLSGIFT
jgi:hypothetical protein